MKSYIKAIAASLLLGLLIMANTETKANAADIITGERPIEGLSYYLDKCYEENADFNIAELFTEAAVIPETVAFANVNDYLNIRKSAGTSASIVGYLPKDGMCEILDTKDGWAHIKSGKITGYVSEEYLITGEKAIERALCLSTLMATCNAGTVNFRSEPDSSDDENIIATVKRGVQLPVIEECVISKENDTIWVKAYCDDLEGYIAKEFVDVAYDWDKAVSLEAVLNGESNVGANSLRNQIIIEAKKHIGLKYVWGGNSLTTGCDCSGFCLAVYRACGFDTSTLPRASYDIAASSKGKTVSLANAKPGDMVFYGSSSGKINHVALYMGNGMIIHESGRKYGCMVSPVDYRTIVKIKSFLD
ncbi:MAG: C40 family peptidase [Lachnospiraceae bacterium]|nr:C40 family peptidase [Lachnospiraceae bacterium]